MSSRRFPGVVLQGDTLFTYFKLTSSLRQSLKDCNLEEAADLAEQLEDSLREILEFYEYVLAKHSIRLPYFKGD